MAENIGMLQAHIGLNTMPLAAGARQSQAIFRGIGASAMKLSGVMAGLGVSIGGLMAMKGLVTTGAQFQQTMETVGGVMRSTGAEFDALTAKAREMGETTEWTANQAAEALKFLGMAGFNAAEAMSALPGTLDLATAGGIDLGRAADIATNALTAMQLPVQQLARVNDVFVATITRSNTNMEMMAESFKYAAPIARAMGYSIEELSALIGKLGDAGLQGSSAGTQLAMAFTKAGQYAAKMGYESGDLLDVLENLKDEMKDMASPIDRANRMMEIFGIRGARAALVLMEDVDAAKAFQETMGDVGGEAKTLADRMRNTVSGSFKELQSVIQEVGIAAFTRFGNKLQEMIKNTAEWVRTNKETILDVLTAAAAAIGTLAQLLGGIIDLVTRVTGEVIGLFTSVGSSVDEAKTQMEELGKQAEKTSKIMVWEAFKAQNAWSGAKWWDYIYQWTSTAGKAILEFGKLVLRVMNEIAAVIEEAFSKQVLGRLNAFITSATQSVAELVEGQGSLGDRLKRIGEIWQTSFNPGTIGEGFNARIEQAWKDTLGEMDWTGIYAPARAAHNDFLDDMAKEWQKLYGPEVAKTMEAIMRLQLAMAGVYLPGGAPIHRKKPVGGGGGGEEVKWGQYDSPGEFVGPPNIWGDYGGEQGPPRPPEFDQAIADAEALEARWRAFTDTGRNMMKGLMQSVSAFGSEFSSTLATALVDGKNAFEDFGEAMDRVFKNMIKRIAEVALELYVMRPAMIGIFGKEAMAGVFAGGGIVGMGGPQRLVPASAFAGAPHAEGGGIPIIAHRGEAILTQQQLSAVASGRGGAVDVHYHGVTGGEVEVENMGGGDWRIEVMDAVESAMLKGRFNRALGKTRGGYGRGIER